MRQVPTYLIIGNGRMAKHFCHYLSLLKIPFLQWARKTHSLQDLADYQCQATHILLLISDSSIPTFLNDLKVNSQTLVVHFSGMLSIAGAFSTHPLMTFSQDLYEDQLYYKMPFILEASSLPLSKLLPGLPNQSYAISATLKPFYHALCVMSNNFTCLLWQKIMRELSGTFNLPEEIIYPYLTQTFKNLAHNPHGALTGPLVRNDHKTIQAHLRALEKDNFAEIYQSFVNFYRKQHTAEACHENT